MAMRMTRMTARMRKLDKVGEEMMQAILEELTDPRQAGY